MKKINCQGIAIEEKTLRGFCCLEQKIFASKF